MSRSCWQTKGARRSRGSNVATFYGDHESMLPIFVDEHAQITGSTVCWNTIASAIKPVGRPSKIRSSSYRLVSRRPKTQNPRNDSDSGCVINHREGKKKYKKKKKRYFYSVSCSQYSFFSNNGLQKNNYSDDIFFQMKKKFMQFTYRTWV